jgi:hypothetical protein
MSFAASAPTRLNFSNSVCSTQGLSAKVNIFGVVCVCVFALSKRENSFLPPSLLPLDKKIPKEDLLRARARFVTSRDVKTNQIFSFTGAD